MHHGQFDHDARAAARAVHEHEVFGPVATLLAYDEHPENIVTRGNGGRCTG